MEPWNVVRGLPGRSWVWGIGRKLNLILRFLKQKLGQKKQDFICLLRTQWLGSQRFI